MKKFAIFLLTFIIACATFFVPGAKLFAFADGEETKYYLISASYTEENYQIKYGIKEGEATTLYRPRNEQSHILKSGASISPVSDNTEEQETNSFNRTYFTNHTIINSSQSVYMYVYFDKVNVHDLTIKLGDGVNNAVYEIESSYLAKEIGTSNGIAKYGWMLLELPLSSRPSGLDYISQMQIIYSSDTIKDGIKYSYLRFYEPYVADAKSTDIVFSEKQDYLSFDFSLPEIDKIYDGDTWSPNKITKQLFKYCFIGDVNYLTNATSDYSFTLEIVDNDTLAIVGHYSEVVTPSYKFKEGDYTLRMVLYTTNDSRAVGEKAYNYHIQKYVPMYVNYGFANMIKGQEFVYDITINPTVYGYRNLRVNSNNPNAASVTLTDDNKVVITAKNSGNVTVTLDIEISRDNETYESYSTSYSFKIAGNNEINWIIIAIIGGLVLAGSILIVIILVRRKQINNPFRKF